MSFLIALLPRIICAALAIPLRTFSDELATMATPAYLAGNNWADVIANSSYYGFGFYCFFTPVFMLTDNPFIIYKSILITCSILTASIAPICFYMLNSFFLQKNNINNFLISVLCSFLVVTRVTITYNEHMLILGSWIIALLICHLWKAMHEDNVKEKRKYTVFLCILLAYLLTIHTRALTYILALLGLIIFCFFTYKKLLVSRIAFLLIFIGYFVSKILVSSVQRIIWLATDGSKLANASIHISQEIDWLSGNTWITLLHIIIGQITTISVFSCGLFSLTLFVWGIMEYRLIKCKVVIKKHCQLAMLLVTLFGSAIGATILAQALTWMPGAVQGVSENIVEMNYYSYKVFTYVRYFGPYIGPFILGGLIITLEYHTTFLKIRYYWQLFTLFISAYFLKCLLPFIQNNANTMEVFMPFSFWVHGDEVSAYSYIGGIIVLNAFVILILAKVDGKSSWRKLFLLIILVLVFEYAYCARAYDGKGQEKQYTRLMERSYEFFEKIKPILEKEKVNDIYVMDKTTATNHQCFYLYQFYMNRFHIIPYKPDEIKDNMIVFSNKNISEDFKSEKGWILKLGESEYVFVEEKLAEKIKREVKIYEY